MIIWIYGEDTYRSRQKLKEMVEKFKQKFDAGGLNLILFKEKWDVNELFQAVVSAPFLAKKKMVIIENLSQHVKKSELDDLANLWNRVPDETILIFWEQEEKGLDKYFGSMPKKDAHYYKYPLLSPHEVKQWLSARAQQKDIDIDSQILDQLLNKVGHDLWSLESELDKLKARSGGKKVQPEYIDELVDTRLEDNIFVFCNYLAQRKSSQALEILQGLIKSGFSESELLNKLGWQLKILLKSKSYWDQNINAPPDKAARDLKMHPYVIKKTKPLLKDFDLKELKQIYQKTLLLENDIKLGKIPPRLGLELIVSQI